MPIDSSIPLGVRPAQIESPINMLGHVLQLQGAQSQNALAQYSINKAQRQDEETNRLAQLLGGGGVDLSTPEGIAKAYSVAPTMAGQYIKGQLDQKKTVSDIGLNDAKAKFQGSEAVAKAVATQRDALAGVNTPQDAVAWMQSAYANPDLKPITGSMPLEQALARVPTDPAQFQQWKQQMALGATKFMELNKPTIHMQDTGGWSNVVSIPGMGGAPTVLSTTAKTQSPDNAATNATHVQTTGMANATSRANNAAMIAKDYTVAGIKPDGTPLAPPTADGKEEPWIVNAATRYNMTGVLPTNLGRGGQGAQDIKRIQREAARQATESGMTPEQLAVQQVTAKKALASFAPGGKDGQAVESANTALNHLDTLRQLAEAQGNGDIRLFNQIANAIATQTGGPAPTNLQSAVTMVGPEISKAVIGVGGGQGDREKVDAALSALTKGGPAQAAGTIATMRDLFGGRLTEKQRSYERGTGMKDFATAGGFLSPAAQKVLAARTGAASNPVTSAIDAELARRGGK